MGVGVPPPPSGTRLRARKHKESHREPACPGGEEAPGSSPGLTAWCLGDGPGVEEVVGYKLNAQLQLRGAGDMGHPPAPAQKDFGTLGRSNMLNQGLLGQCSAPPFPLLLCPGPSQPVRPQDAALLGSVSGTHKMGPQGPIISPPLFSACLGLSPDTSSSTLWLCSGACHLLKRVPHAPPLINCRRSLSPVLSEPLLCRLFWKPCSLGTELWSCGAHLVVRCSVSNFFSFNIVV